MHIITQLYESICTHMDAYQSTHKHLIPIHMLVIQDRMYLRATKGGEATGPRELGGGRRPYRVR